MLTKDCVGFFRGGWGVIFALISMQINTTAVILWSSFVTFISKGFWSRMVLGMWWRCCFFREGFFLKQFSMVFNGEMIKSGCCIIKIAMSNLAYQAFSETNWYKDTCTIQDNMTLHSLVYQLWSSFYFVCSIVTWRTPIKRWFFSTMTSSLPLSYNQVMVFSWYTGYEFELFLYQHHPTNKKTTLQESTNMYLFHQNLIWNTTPIKRNH